MDLSLEQKQHLLITPQMQQAMLILQLNNLELSEYISTLALENPAIEVALPNDREEMIRDSNLDKLEWLDSMDEHNRGDALGASDRGESKGFELPSPQGETLSECLHLQLLAYDLDVTSQRIASRIIDSLDENGYLTEPLTAIAEALHVGISPATVVLSLIQQCEPTGVGARDLRECLSIQLHAMGASNHPAYHIVQNHLDDLAHNRITHIAEMLNLSIEEVAGARQLILQLDPKPAKSFSLTKPQYVSADVRVENVEGEYVAFINDNRVPIIHINGFYKRLASRTDDAQVKKYLVGKFKQANWVVKCIDQRNSTILKSTQKLIGLQEEFFEYGPNHLAPMTLSDISDSIGMHVSTVSRTFKGKYLQCTWGLFPFSFFLSPVIKNSQSDSVSSQKIKAEIKALIAAENRKRPMSDEEIVLQLSQKGVGISRRTIAKYRSELGILSSKLRKEF